MIWPLIEFTNKVDEMIHPVPYGPSQPFRLCRATIIVNTRSKQGALIQCEVLWLSKVKITLWSPIIEFGLYSYGYSCPLPPTSGWGYRGSQCLGHQYNLRMQILSPNACNPRSQIAHKTEKVMIACEISTCRDIHVHVWSKKCEVLTRYNYLWFNSHTCTDTTND